MLPKIEVIEIYPSKTKHIQEDVVEHGTVHVHLAFDEVVEMDIRNIKYKVIKKGSIKKIAAYPHSMKYNKDDLPAFTVSFKDSAIWREIRKLVIQEIKDNL